MESHKRFCEELKLPFPLLADEKGKVSELYGILIKRNNNAFSGRSVFLIDLKGNVVFADSSYSLRGDEDHAALIKKVKTLATKGGK